MVNQHLSQFSSIINTTLIDADKVAHELYIPGGELLKKLEDHLGNKIISKDGTLNRAELVH